jgi:hypothetical protein
MVLRTLFFDNSGPMIQYQREGSDGLLLVDDLNPEAHISFRLAPRELLLFGIKCVWAAVRGI